MLASSDTLPRPRSCATWIKFTHPTRRPGLSWQAYLADCLGAATAPRTVRSEHIEVRAAELGIMLTDDLNAGFGGLISRKDRAAELIKDRRVKRDTYRDDEQVRAEAEVVALADAMSRKDYRQAYSVHLQYRRFRRDFRGRWFWSMPALKIWDGVYEAVDCADTHDRVSGTATGVRLS